MADVLAFGDEDAQDNNENDDGAGRRRRRARGQVPADIPLVKDIVGESVAESFETFLKKCVPLSSYIS